MTVSILKNRQKKYAKSSKNDKMSIFTDLQVKQQHKPLVQNPTLAPLRSNWILSGLDPLNKGWRVQGAKILSSVFLETFQTIKEGPQIYASKISSCSQKTQPNGHIGPDFESSYLNVSCNISATTPPILDSDGVFEPPDP